MEVKRMIDKTPLAKCKQTNIESELLKAILCTGDKGKFGHITSLIASGHDEWSPARQIFSYLIRRALKIVRQPGTYDIKLIGKCFDGLSEDDIEAAVKDVERIYKHTQIEMSQYGDSFSLVRGIGGIEAEVSHELLNAIQGKDIHFYFRTITFFNHQMSPFSRDMVVNIDCPVEWIWASAYTLKELELPGSDEEFIVACQSPNGMMIVPKSNFSITTKTPITFNNTLRHPQKSSSYRGDGLHQALSALMEEGFEPDDYERAIIRHEPGDWEKRCMKIGQWLDEKIGNDWQKKRIFVRSKKAH
jgi:hypothetical protein